MLLKKALTLRVAVLADGFLDGDRIYIELGGGEAGVRCWNVGVLVVVLLFCAVAQRRCFLGCRRRLFSCGRPLLNESRRCCPRGVTKRRCCYETI